jgi:hypothetical protein
MKIGVLKNDIVKVVRGNRTAPKTNDTHYLRRSEFVREDVCVTGRPWKDGSP